MVGGPDWSRDWLTEELLKGRVVALIKGWLEIKVSVCTPWRFMGSTFTDPLILTLGKRCRWRRDSMLRIMTWLRPGRSRHRILAGPSIPPLELPQPRIQWLPGALFPEVKRPGREAHHSPSSSAEFKNEWSYTTTTSPICFHGLYWDLYFFILGAAERSGTRPNYWFSGTHSREGWVGLRAGLVNETERLLSSLRSPGEPSHYTDNTTRLRRTPRWNDECSSPWQCH